ncbi:MAG: RNA polymerase sigma-70 factor [Bacteroidota bacterium]
MSLLNAPLTITQEINSSVLNSRNAIILKTREITDEELYGRVQKKDCYQSFKRLFEKNYNRVFFYAKKYTDVAEISEEAVSEVFLKLWKRRKLIRVTSSFQSYLFTSVRNKCLDILRKEAKSKFESDSLLESTPSTHSVTMEIVESNELQQRIEKAIEKLPKDRRKIFLMSRNKGLKYQEIANILGISIKTVETQMGRSLRYLREKFSKELEEFRA